MNNLLHKSTAVLATFLDRILPLISKNWWENTVIDKLSFSQKQRIEQKGLVSLSSLDLAALLRILDQNWYQISTKLNATSEDRHFVKEMQTIRNRWAHAGSKEVPLDDLYRDLDTLQRFITIIQAENTFIQEIDDRKSSLLDKKAEQMYKEKIKVIEIKNNLPEAWNKLMSEPNHILTNLLNETLEKICGHRANDQQIETFFKSKIGILGTIKHVEIDKKPAPIEIRHQHKKIKPQSPKKKQNPKGFPPEGTLCRFTYKGNNYNGKIKNGRFEVQGYQHFSSFSAASLAITNTSRNGWRDWELQTPESNQWLLANIWRKKNLSSGNSN